MENDAHDTIELVADPKDIIDIIKKHLNAGHPIVVGVNHTLGKGINNLTVDHFIVINGMGYDEERQQLYFNYIETGRSKQWAEQTLDDSWRLIL